MKNEVEILLTRHAIKRFKKRTKIKRIGDMLKRAKQAFINGFLYGEIGYDKIVSFNGIDYVFKSTDVDKECLLTIYKTDKQNGFIRKCC